MAEKVLVTGGCGFIGSHLVDRLVAEGRDVRVLDSLEVQVHGGGIPEYLNSGASYQLGNVLDEEALGAALDGVDTIYHLAASVGVGQSMYQIRKYVGSNTYATAKLLDEVVNRRRGDLRKLVVASSMSVYGEGAYACEGCGVVRPARSAERLEGGEWEPLCPGCGGVVKAVPITEDAALEPTSVYALSKMDQEKLCLLVGQAYEIPTVALRFFNVYGSRQALSNPYTGVAAIFSSRIKAGNPPLIYEDGEQKRAFVSVSDIVQALMLAEKSDEADGQVLNVGSGAPISIADLARLLLRLYGKEGELEPVASGQFRQGDIRHCFADIRAIERLGYSPQVDLESGLADLARWAEGAEASDLFETAQGELRAKGLV